MGQDLPRGTMSSVETEEIELGSPGKQQNKIFFSFSVKCESQILAELDIALKAVCASKK